MCLDFGGERSEPVEQRAVGIEATSVLHVAHQRRQLRLDPLDDRQARLRFRQAEQSQRPIRLDLKDALRQRAGAGRREPLIDDKEAHEAVRVGQEIGGDDRAFVLDFGGDDICAGKRSCEIGRLVGRHNVYVDCDDQRARLRHERHGAAEHMGGRLEGVAAGREFQNRTDFHKQHPPMPAT